MNKLIFLLSIGLAALIGAARSPVSAVQPDTRQTADELFTTISALDSAVFGALNNCITPWQLQKHASFFAPDVELYHDTGGVTWNRQDMIANTEKYVCGHFRRELVPGSLRVFRIKDFGAIAQGTHRFCQFKAGTCDGLADFAIIWHLQDGEWRITRVLGYGRRSSEAGAL